jgi:hypothetical protein
VLSFITHAFRVFTLDTQQGGVWASDEPSSTKEVGVRGGEQRGETDGIIASPRCNTERRLRLSA